MVINYQAYADGLTNQQAYLDLYADLAQFVESVSPPGRDDLLGMNEWQEGSMEVIQAGQRV
jgi:hypothetical protein